jgi:hypothetical protein
MFYCQLSQGGTYLMLACANCTEPLLFQVEPLSDFPGTTLTIASEA